MGTTTRVTSHADLRSNSGLTPALDSTSQSNSISMTALNSTTSRTSSPVSAPSDAAANAFSGSSVSSQSPEAPSHSEIAVRAYEIFLTRGACAGHDLDDWLQAETELSSQRAQALSALAASA